MKNNNWFTGQQRLTCHTFTKKDISPPHPSSTAVCHTKVYHDFFFLVVNFMLFFPTEPHGLFLIIVPRAWVLVSLCIETAAYCVMVLFQHRVILIGFLILLKGNRHFSTYNQILIMFNWCYCWALLKIHEYIFSPDLIDGLYGNWYTTYGFWHFS